MTDLRQPIAARFTGKSVPRKEDRRLVTGHGRYVDDVRRPGQLHLAFLRSEVAAGTIRSIDTSAAAQLDGVVAVFTAEDLNRDTHEMYWSIMGPAMPMTGPLAPGRVVYVGDPVAAVVATTRYIAEDAVDLIEIEYELVAPILNYKDAARITDRFVHPEAGSNAMASVPFTPMSPDIDEAFSNADHVIETVIESHRYIAVPMEPRGVLATWDPGTDELDVVISTQSVHEVRGFCARMLGVPEASVTVSMRDVGGGFGSKMLIGREEAATVLAARRLGASIKWIEDRRENLIAAPHSRNERALVRVAVDDDGTIQAIAADSQCDLGAYPAAAGPMDVQLLTGPYKIPRLGFAMEMTWSNTMGKGPYRGPWMFETTAREMMLDIVARQIGMDPAELRRRNILREADLPFTSPGMKEFQEITPGETLDQALEILGYDEFRAEQQAARDEGRYLGVGIACYVEPTTMAFPGGSSEGATLRVEQSGKVSVYLSTSSHGQSVETTMAQLVADQLGVEYEDVTIVQGDTRSTPYGAGTGGSRTATLAGGAAHRASVAMRQKIVAIAAHLLEAAPEDIELSEGQASVVGTPSKGVSLAEIARMAYMTPESLPLDLGSGLEVTERFRPDRFPTWSNATHICVVEVDASTWEPRVLRYIVSEDCGRMINPRVVEGQISGGVVQGLGGVLLEDFVYDADGNPLTTTFMDYLLPTATEVPNLEIGHIVTDATSNPGGFKGMGEGGAIGSHAAVANAVSDALAPFGVTVTSTPLGPGQIYELIKEARSMKPAPFDYHAPATLEEAAELLSSLDDVKVLAGGQSLIPILALRLTRFEHLVDLGRVQELKGISRSNGTLTIRAMTTHAEIGASDTVATGAPLVAKATPLIGHFQIRNRGTLGGSIVHADPAAEYPAVAAALDATMVVSSSRGSRRIPASAFFESTFMTSIADDEVLTAVEFPVWGESSGFGVSEVARRHGDFALVGAMAGVRLDGATVAQAAVAIFGVGGTPIRAREAEAALVGSAVAADAANLAEVGKLAASDLDPASDVHASAAYRQEIAAVVVERALTTAIKEASAVA